jgi:signal transduction histidine kinase
VRLPTRLALVGVLTLGVTLVAVGLLTYQLVRVSGRQDVDRVLERELDGLVAGLPDQLPAGTTPSAADLLDAAARHLALNPGTAQHLAVVTIDGAGTRFTAEGPPDLVELVQTDRLPDVEVGTISTADTPSGEVRVLSAPLDADGTTVGTATFVGSLQEARRSASAALVRIAGAGAIGLVVGGVALTLATRRALAPVGALAGAARATGGDDLGRRVPEPERDDEIGVLAHEFNRMLDRIAAADEERLRVLAAVSHELRTPLAVARGHLEVFESMPDGYPAADARELAGVLRRELDRLTRIVADLGTVSRGDAGYGVETGPVFVPDVVDDLRARLTGLGLEDRVDVGDAPPVVVEADQDRLAQSVLNLVLNATTHNPDGTAVRVAAAAGDGTVALTVADDGPGLDPSVRDRAFEPFVTTRAGGKERTSGLGLAVVKALTEAQGGAVSLASSDAGTTVTLTFPVLS